MVISHVLSRRRAHFKEPCWRQIIRKKMTLFRWIHYASVTVNSTQTILWKTFFPRITDGDEMGDGCWAVTCRRLGSLSAPSLYLKDLKGILRDSGILDS